MIHLKLSVLEDELPADYLAERDLDRAWAPPAGIAWWASVLARLSENRRFKHPWLNPELTAEGLTEPETTIQVMLCSRASFEHLTTACDGALGAHLVMTPEDDAFGEGGMYARAYRVLVVSDRAEFLHSIEQLARDDAHPHAYLDEYLGSYLTTAFHEIAHALLFAENAALLPPAEIDLLSETGEFGKDISDCSTCHGIRPLLIDGKEVWSATPESAQEDMEVYVEQLGHEWMHLTLRGIYAPETFATAMGVKEELDRVLGTS